MSDKVRKLFYDLEISPTLGWTYGLWDTRVIHVEREPHIMCFAYRWEGEPVKCISQIDYKDYTKHPYDDKSVVEALWKLLDEADIVIAHNANRFDNKVANERFLVHHLGPPSPYKTIDTLAEVRKNFKNGSNSLDNLCKKLELGSKPDEKHSNLWRSCLDGDKYAWKKMIQYCKNDVILLNELYDTIFPYIKNKPNIATLSGKPENCPACGANGKHLQYRGYYTTKTGKYHQIWCKKCGSWSRERLMDKDIRKYETPDYVSI